MYNSGSILWRTPPVKYVLPQEIVVYFALVEIRKDGDEIASSLG
jgi:hypothetical protein